MRRSIALHAALVSSGFAALVYEMSWSRMLHRVFGVSDLAIATVLAAFFLGLGLGSGAIAARARRVQRPGRLYAALEVGVAVIAALSPFVVPQMGSAYAALGAERSVETLAVLRLLLAFAVLLPPTVLMGATLPVLATLTADRRGWADGVTGLYVSNTLGAMFGAGAAGLFLIPEFGARNSTFIAAAASLVAAAIVMWVFGSSRRVPEENSEEDSPRAASPTPRASSWLAAGLAAGTGLSALAGEVLFTRVLRTIFHATTQAFSTMLVTYLFGIAIGAVIARRLARSRLGAAGGLALTQCAAALFIAGSMFATPQVLRITPILRGTLSGGVFDPWTALVVSALILGPLALALGTGLPLAWSLADDLDGNATRASGRLLAANTLGGLVGSLAAGFVMVPAIGVEASLIVVMFAHLLIAGAALRRVTESHSAAMRAVSFTAPLGLGVLILVASPSLDLGFLLHGMQDPVRSMVDGPSGATPSLLFLREGRSSTVTVLERPGVLQLYNDGRPESGLGQSPPGFGVETALLGSLPAVLRSDRERAMAIGLGAGNTTQVLLAAGYAHIDVVELEGAVVEAARFMHQRTQVPFPIDDPRVHLVVDDARHQLVLAPADRYDAVVSQPSHPWLAGSSALYTYEFFAEVDHALTERGVFSLWVNLFHMRVEQIRAILRTLNDVFPHVVGFVAEPTSLVLIASRAPLAFDAGFEAEVARLTPPLLATVGLPSAGEYLARLELDRGAVAALGRGAPRIVDDRPLLEFALANVAEEEYVRLPDFDRALSDVPWWGEPLASGNLAVDTLMTRIGLATSRPVALDRLEASLPEAGLDAPDRAMVEGALALARGDAQNSLRHFDASTRERAAFLADDLRQLEGRGAESLRIASQRGVDPSSAGPLLRAALDANEPWAMDAALAVAARVHTEDRTERALVRFVDRERTAPCSSFLEHRTESLALASEVGEVAFSVQACAFAANDREAAAQLGTQFVRNRRAIAEDALATANLCLNGGNRGCAMLLFGRALRHYPSNSAAAIGLATLLDRAHRRDEARAVLLRTLANVSGITASEQALARTAAQLRLDIGIQPEARSANTSAAPDPVETPSPGEPPRPAP